MNNAQREKQMAEAEELLSDFRSRAGFAKGLYFGNYRSDRLVAYPRPELDETTTEMETELEQFCETQIDPVRIDREAMISDDVVAGLGKLGVLGACLPKSVGGRELTQASYCKLLEVLGGHCASTALFVNAHHSIGPRALVLFGTPEQQAKYLPKSVTGEWINAFALTEPEAGSDAANVQTTATPTEDGRGYLLNGQKRWITNGGIAQVLTVMARTPVPGSKETKITAFIVTPDMPGFEVVEKRMSKMGVRGSATARLSFKDVFVPKENILGKLGKGLKVALTVLDFGRTTFGASCTGAAKYCLSRAVQHANHRVQFGQTLGQFELVKEKIAYMEAGIFAIESATYQTAALIDSGDEDYMLETAMLKVFATETLWKIVNDTFQIYGGKAYFTDEPFERILRDARINPNRRRGQRRSAQLHRAGRHARRRARAARGARSGEESAGQLRQNQPLHGPQGEFARRVAGRTRAIGAIARRRGAARAGRRQVRRRGRGPLADAPRSGARQAIPARASLRRRDGTLRLRLRTQSARRTLPRRTRR